jgi:hypothetical protein
MAEKVIGLRIELNGFKGVITNIKQLEDELRKAKEDLNELEIGSKNFKQLTTEISRAESKLGDLRKASEGIGVEKQLEGYGKLAGGITQSFAAAQSALVLFGNESDAIGEAAAQVQNLLTVALAVRGVQETVLGGQIVARTVAEKAATAATLTTNKALKVLYTTIAANPIGALITAITLVVGAMILWNQSSEESVDIQKELSKVVSTEASQLNTYSKILKDVNSSNNARLSVINDLKKTYPGFNVFLDAENRLTKDGVKFIENKVKALVLQAKAQQLVKQITETETKVLEENSKSIDETLNLWDELTSSLGAYYGLGGAIGIDVVRFEKAEAKKQQATKESTRVIDLSRQALNEVEDQLGALDKENAIYEAQMRKQAETDKNAGKAKKEVIEATKAQLALEKQLNDELKQLQLTYSTYLKFIQDVAKTSLIKTPKPEILTNIEALVKGRESLLEDPLEKVFKGLGYEVEVADGQLKGLVDTFDKAQDTFGAFYENARKDLTTNLLLLDPEQYAKKLGSYIDEANRALLLPADDPNKISNEAFVALQGIVEQYAKLNVLIKTPPGIDEVFSNETLIQFYETQKQIGIAQEQIRFEIDKTDGSIKDVDKSQALLYTQTEKQKVQLNEWAVNLKKFYTSIFEGEDETKKLDLISRLNLTPEQQEKLKENWGTAQNEIIKTIDEIVKTQIDGIKVISSTIVEEESDIRNFYVELRRAIKEGRELDASTLKEVLLKNKELVFQATQETNKIVIDAEYAKINQLETLNKFVEDLDKKGVNIKGLSEKEKYELFKFYLDKQVSDSDKAAKETEDAFKKRVEAVSFYLAEFSKALTSVSSIVAQSFQIQLDRLEYEYKDTMDNIVGDTKEASDKRLETEKSYQAEKAKIERAAQISALRFTLASTVAQGAQSIVSALTLPPPANIIVGALNAGITAAQVAIIQTQINDIQSRPLRRGGLLAMGGYISGASHEQGGVYAGGGYTLEGNESVINRQSTLQYSGLLSQINQSQVVEDLLWFNHQWIQD